MSGWKKWTTSPAYNPRQATLGVDRCSFGTLGRGPEVGMGAPGYSATISWTDGGMFVSVDVHDRYFPGPSPTEEDAVMDAFFVMMESGWLTMEDIEAIFNGL